MMYKTRVFFLGFFIATVTQAQVTLTANGTSNTYGLITSVLAPGANPIETPDCGHSAFGNHIDQVFDALLNKSVFRFHIHVTPDNDRCQEFDRQRNEIKTYAQSPANLLGVENESVIYKWKFKLPAGFQSSSNFTHIHQLKTVGDPFESMPMYTLTTRKGTPDMLQLRYAQTGTQSTIHQVPISAFLDTWVEVTERIKYSTAGTYAIEIKRISDNAVLFSYSNANIINWRAGGTFVRPKWGIYRSLINAQDLRDEQVLFDDFSIQEVANLSTATISIPNFSMTPNPANDQITLANLPDSTSVLTITSMDGKQVLNQTINTIKATVDTSNLANSTYIVTVTSNTGARSSALLVVSK